MIDLGLPDGCAFELGAKLRHRFGAAFRLVGFTAQDAPQLEPLEREAGYDEVIAAPRDVAGVLLALGGPSAALVARGATALFAWHCMLVDHGFQQLGMAGLLDPIPARRKYAQVEKTVDRIRAYLHGEELDPERRNHLRFQLALLEKAVESRPR